MKLKLNEDGNAVVQDGKPVYVHDDGQEIAFDAPSAMNKISELNAESAKHRRSAKEVKEKLAVFGDIDPDKAVEAVKIVQDLDDKKLVDAGEMDRLKASLSESFTREKNSFKDQLSAKDKLIRKLTVSSQFAQSDFIRSKTVLTPDIAESAFGNAFDVEEHDGRIDVVGKLNGNPIYSRERPGEYANFEEALGVILDARSDKASILRAAGSSGSGAHGGNGTGGNPQDNPWQTGDRTAQAKLIKADRARAAMLATQAGKEVPGLNA